MQQQKGQILALKLIVLAVLMAIPQIVAAESTEDILTEVSVKSKMIRETAMGPTEDYVANRAITATKMDTPIIETPQSISVVTQQQMREQGAYTLQDALSYTTGVTAGAYGLDARGDWLFIRGVAHMQIYDGLRSNDQSAYNSPRPDPFFLERVEVLRGPNSVLFGQGSVGGLVNIVSKRPQAEKSGQIGVQYGMFDRKRIEGDFTGKLDENGEWMYRLIGAVRHTDTQTDYTDNQRYQLAPSLTWKPSDNTMLNVQLTLFKDKTDGANTNFLPHSGTIVSNPNGQIPIGRFAGEPGFDQFDQDYQAINWQFEHAFNDTFTFRQNGRYAHSKYDYAQIYPWVFNISAPGASDGFLNPELSEMDRAAFAVKVKDKTFSLDNHLQAKFDWGSIQHTLIAGLDYFKNKKETARGSGDIFTPFNLFDPVYGNFDPLNGDNLPVLTRIADENQDLIGLYLQDQIKLGKHWAFTLGLRNDRTNKKIDDGSRTQTDHETTGRIGVVYLAENGFAPYASYTESFLPVSGQDVYGKSYTPKTGKQYELGLRYRPQNSNSIYTISYFDLEEKNRLNPDPNDPNNQLQGGKGLSRGIEFEAIANLMDKIDLIANYSYIHARTKDANGPGTGKLRIAEVHDHTASIWATYQFAIADIPGFKVGAGARYVGSNSDETGTLNIPSVTLFDAMLSWENAHWRTAINGTNLGDKHYYTTCLSRGDCYVANRMNVVGSLSYKF